MSKTISISNLEMDNYSKSRQINKELFESRLQLNSFKKTYNAPFSIKVNRSLEKTNLSISSKSKDLSFQKYFKIPKKTINNDRKRLNDLEKNKVRLNLNLRKLSNKRIELTHSLYINPKTANNSIINKRIINPNFINNNYSTVRNCADKNQFKRKEIKIQKKNIKDMNKTIIKDILKVNNNKRDGVLSLNVFKSTFKDKIFKHYNKSGIIRTTYNNYNNKNKSRNILLYNNIKKNSKEVFKKKTMQKNIINKNKQHEISLNFHKDNTLNNFVQYINKKKYIFLNRNNKTLQTQSYNTNKIDKISFIKNNVALKNNKNKIYNFKNTNNNLQVNNVNINNYISCNISYINNLNNEKKINKNKNNNNSRNNNKIAPLKESANNFIYNNSNIIINNYKNNNINSKSKNSNILNEEKNNDNNLKKRAKELIINEKNNYSDSIFETEKKDKSKNDIDDSKQDSGLLSFDKIEDLIVYYNMQDIKKNENFLFFKNDRKNFYYKYLNILNNNFFDFD